MANYTTNYNLKKPLGNENYNIEDQNGNMDIIDAKLKEIDNKASNITVPVTSVNAKTGAVVLSATDIKLADGTTTVTGAINELNANKLSQDDYIKAPPFVVGDEVAEVKIIDDFAGKVSGSVVENPNKVYACITDSLKTPTDITGDWRTGFEESSQENINKISSLDNSCYTGKTLANITSADIPQQLFSFNLIEIVERKYGSIPKETVAEKVEWLKDNLFSISCNWYGYGSCPSGNKAMLMCWYDNMSIWNTTTKQTHNASTSTLLRSTRRFTEDQQGYDMIDSNGFVHYLAYTDPSDGVTPSVINTDYVSIELTFKIKAVAEFKINSPVITEYKDGMGIIFKPTHSAEIGLLNWSGLGARGIKKLNGNNLKIEAGSIYTLRYNGTAFILQGEGGEYGTATADKVLSGYTIGTENGIVSGTMPNNSGKTQEAAATYSQEGLIRLRPPKGYYDGANGSCVDWADGNFKPENIKSGVSIFGQTGTFTSDATATASQILSGKTAYVKGNKITGTMPNNGAKIITPSTTNQAIPAGYHNGSGYVKGDANLKAENIKNGVSIFGVLGSLIPENIPIAYGTTGTTFGTSLNGGSSNKLTYNSPTLTFTPKIILIAPIRTSTPIPSNDTGDTVTEPYIPAVIFYNNKDVGYEWDIDFFRPISDHYSLAYGVKFDANSFKLYCISTNEYYVTTRGTDVKWIAIGSVI